MPLSRSGRRHRFGYLATGNLAASWFHDGILRIDAETGERHAFRFGPGYYVGEPIFAPDPASTREDGGWLVCEVLEGRAERTFMAVFDAAHVEAGPIARVQLRHHLPISFHGWWEAAQS